MGLGYSNSRRTKAGSVVILVPSLDPDDDKWCWICKQYKSKSKFYSDSTKSDGIAPKCKECDNRTRIERDQKTRK